MKNVAIIIYSLENGGGAEKNASFLSEYLVKYFNLYVFVDKDCEDTYDCKGTIIRLSEANEGNEILSSKALKILKRRYQIDISISFGNSLNIANILSRENDRVIVSERTTYSRHMPRRSFVEKEIQEYYRYADEIVACSYGVKKDVYDITKGQINGVKVIYNFIDADRTRLLALEQEDTRIQLFLDGSPYFVNVGRFVDAKRQDCLITKFAEFRREVNGNYKLVIIGYGERKKYLENIIKKEGLEDCVGIFSDVENVFSIIKKADAFILSSYREGFPNVLLEAMSLGVPIVSSDCLSGPRELLDDEQDYSVNYVYPKICKRGILFADDGYGLKEALEQIIRDKKLRGEIELAQKDYIQNYNHEAIWNQWFELMNGDVDHHECLSNGESMLDRCEHIYIYGAGKIGHRVYNTYFDKYRIDGFIVTDKREQSYSHMNSEINVMSLDEVDISDDTIGVIIGVSDEYIEDVCRSVINAGCKKIFFPW